jgi:hypothetical protein
MEPMTAELTTESLIATFLVRHKLLLESLEKISDLKHGLMTLCETFAIAPGSTPQLRARFAYQLAVGFVGLYLTWVLASKWEGTALLIAGLLLRSQGMYGACKSWLYNPERRCAHGVINWIG